MGKIKDLTGQKFGRLVALYRLEEKYDNRYLWMCKCDCNEFLKVPVSSLTSGNTKSCGCWKVDVPKTRATHNMSNDRLYKIFTDMKRRCYNKNRKSYKDYGGRGITVCNDWLEKENGFKNFYNWSMENGYNDDLTIDRINSNGNYEPSNCRWATLEIQANNKRSSVYAEINGQIKTLSEWNNLHNFSRGTVWNRYNKGLRGEDLIKPVMIFDNKQSGVEGIRWRKRGEIWEVYVGKKYIGGSKDLDVAINIKNDYES